MKNYWRIRAEKARREIDRELDYINDSLAKEAEEHLGQQFNSSRGWKLSGKRWGLKTAKDILGNNNIWG
jgi:hypothetical protein